LRGVLDLCVLATLRNDALHGYAIAGLLDDAGVGAVKGGTLYPLLARMRAAGYIDARWEPGEHGPGRKYYELTDEGRQVLREQGSAWETFARTTAALIDEGTRAVDEAARANRTA
jgi:PadR family transcriptional regulator PadR